RIVHGIQTARENRSHSPSNRPLADLQFSFAGDERGMSNGDARNVGDGVQRAGHAVEWDPKIASARLCGRLALRGSERRGSYKAGKHCENANQDKTDHFLFFSQEDCADRSNFVFFSTAFSSKAACSAANFQSLFSTASVSPGNSRCA